MVVAGRLSALRTVWFGGALMTDRCKTFWLINQYASTPQTGMGGRHYYLALEMAKQGHNVFLISGSFGHKLRIKENQKRLVEKKFIDGFTHVKLRLLKYPNSHSPKRAINWFLFAFLLGFFIKNRLPRPDAILYSSPALIGYLGARHVAHKLNVPLIFEVRDIWPMTLIELGGFSPRHPFMRFMQWIEDKAYKECRLVLSTLPNAVEHMVNRGMCRKKFAWVPNGFSKAELAKPKPLDPAAVAQLPPDKFIVGYTGTLGVANALDTLLDAAERLKNDPDVVFVLVGGGKEKVALQRRAEDNGLQNIIFIDPIPKAQVQSMLQRFDVCFLGWKDEPLYQYGVSPNKLPEYLVSGKPIIHSFSGACDPVAEAAAGLTVPAEDPVAIAKAIVELKNLPQAQRAIMGQRGQVKL